MPQTRLDLPLESSFPCRAAPGARSRRHAVTIHPDWSVDTGHDPALEDLAAALGADVSCRTALAAVMPGFREWHTRTQRSRLAIRSPDHGTTWFSADGVLRCCPQDGHRDPAAAAAHSRGVTHVARLTTSSRRDLASLVRGLGEMADPAVPIPDTAPDRSALQRAWACGLKPGTVRLIRGALAASGAGEPDELTLLGIVQSGADPAWVATVAAGSGGDLVHLANLRWAAWTSTDADRADPMLRAAWMATGTRRSDVVALTEAGYRPADAEAVAVEWRLSMAGAAQRIAEWAAAGYLPRADLLRPIARAGVGFLPGPPSRIAVRQVMWLLGLPCDDARARTEIAVQLAAIGTVPDTVARLRGDGAHDAQGEGSWTTAPVSRRMAT